MKMDLKKPCSHCPFRYDIPGFLTQERAEEIIVALLNNQSFPCHKTVEYGEDDSGEETFNTQESQHCAGALILLEKLGRPNQWMRIAERLGFYDANELDMSSPVFEDEYEMIEHHNY